MDELGSYSQYLELIAVAIGIVKYKEFKNFQFKYILYFLIYVVLNEFVAGISYEFFKIPNILLYNIYVLIHFAFFLGWYHYLLISKRRRQIVKVFFIVYVFFWIVDVSVLEGLVLINATYSFALGTFLLIITVAFYFIELLNREVVLHITLSPYFWVSFGILVYCITYLPFYIALLFLSKENPIILSVMLFLINCIQYCCFSIAFIRADRNAIEHPISKEGH
ncbi:hypothetical protein [Leeuwenhoekiella sp. W20_SRS_FM14]|uniref:hypothetical protein n=1 Tax=Leeuwenhoekiella sp. W20_SRS_FM14 TaxID=3240270 RepID=UPI003F9C15AF